MTDHDDLEARLRRSLAERADDVDPTPALWQRVDARTGGGGRLGLVLGAVATVAAVGVAFAVVPGLLDPDPVVPDIAEGPDEPVAGPTASPVPTETPAVGEPPFGPLPMAVAQVGEDGLLLRSAEGEVLRRLDEPTWDVRSVVAGPRWTPDAGVVGFVADTPGGTVVGTLDQRDGATSGATFTLPAAPNGDGLVLSADGEALAWLEGAALHVLPLASEAAGLRVLPLEGAPEGLVLQQWVDAVDAPTLVATAAGGGAWSLPIDVGSVYDTAPTDPAIMLPVGSGVTDAAYLPDLRLVTTTPSSGPGSAAVLSVDDDPTLLPSWLADAEQVVLTTTGDLVALVDPTTGAAMLGTVADAQSLDVAVTALAPLAAAAAPTEEPTPDGTTASAADLGLVTDAPLLGTDGRSFVLREADGSTARLEVYPAESEAALGLLAVRPGSQRDDGLVAVESSSEGEVSVRFVVLGPDGASPVGDVLVTQGAVTGLVWSPDGREVAWSDEAGLHVAGVDDAGRTGERVDVAVTGRVLDWTWESGSGSDGAIGSIVLGEPGRGSVLSVARTGGAGVSVDVTPGVGPLVLDTHVPDRELGTPTVQVEDRGDAVGLRWALSGVTGDLAAPGPVGSVADTTVRASGGQVLVLGPDRSVLVTFDGDVATLPGARPLSDWDVLD